MKLQYIGPYPPSINLPLIKAKPKVGETFELDSTNEAEMALGFDLLKKSPEKFIEAERAKPGPKPKEKMADVPKNK